MDNLGFKHSVALTTLALRIRMKADTSPDPAVREFAEELLATIRLTLDIK